MKRSNLSVLEEKEPRVIPYDELYGEQIYYLEEKHHKGENGNYGSRKNELYPIVFYAIATIHTVVRRFFIRIDSEYVWLNDSIRNDFPINAYGIWWRCWDEKPNDKQRKAVAWNE